MPVRVEQLDPLGSIGDAELVVPLHNSVMGELFPWRMPKSVDEFRAGFAAPEAAFRFVAIPDEQRSSLQALGVVRTWTDGTNPQLVFAEVLVRSDSRRRGFGRLILEEVVETAEASDRTLVLVDTVDTVPAGEAFASAVGADIGMREHVSRVSIEDLPFDVLEAWEADAAVRAADYERLAWEDGYSEDHLDQIAALFVMADEDMPYEDAAFEPITETAESLRTRIEVSKPFVSRVTSVAVHRPSGEAVGFSELIRRRSDPATLFTTLTTVHREHRGHGLGKWIKADVISRARARFPHARFIQTENAFSNAAMLAINDAIGFAPACTLTSFQLSTDGIRRYLDR